MTDNISTNPSHSGDHCITCGALQSQPHKAFCAAPPSIPAEVELDLIRVGLTSDARWTAARKEELLRVMRQHPQAVPGLKRRFNLEDHEIEGWAKGLKRMGRAGLKASDPVAIDTRRY